LDKGIVMQSVRKGRAPFVPRARLMLILGEQLITDEVAAISELVKNSYDADAPKVVVTLHRVSEPDVGCIIIRDNGNGMTLDTVLSGWLELGTLSKVRDPGQQPRLSEGRDEKKRVCLGEKGIGRLAVHKLGRQTELVTRRAGSSSETKLTIDWDVFTEGNFLKDVEVDWEETQPSVFTGQDEDKFTEGTQIKITRLQRTWTREMLVRVKRSLWAMKSPFAELSDFDIDLKIDDRLAPELDLPDLSDLVKKATYVFDAEVDDTGLISYEYQFQRQDLGELLQPHKKRVTMDLRHGEHFADERKPVCGPFRMRLYSWDLTPMDQRAVFGDASTYKEMIEPNTGVKVFRDGFRVLPYGSRDDDWLGMDLARIRQFELRLSRNQVIAAIEISSKNNPDLVDKSDREGLIDNEAFKDFRTLVKNALTQFEADRYPDRREVKRITGRIRDVDRDRTVFGRNMVFLSKAIAEQPKLDPETKAQIRAIMSEARQAFDSILTEREEPLLVASSIGLTYMMPTHEVRRDIHEAMKVLRSIRDSRTSMPQQLESAISLLKQADRTVGGIAKLMQKSKDDESFQLEKSAKSAKDLMRYRMERNTIDCQLEVRTSKVVTGSDRLITIMLLNFLDNSIYWLLRMRPEERKIKMVVDSFDSGSILVVSDSGPGFGQDGIMTVTLPFFTRKPDGMGLGLYIANRIAGMSGATLKLLSAKDMPGLLPGANIAVTFPASRSAK